MTMQSEDLNIKKANCPGGGGGGGRPIKLGKEVMSETLRKKNCAYRDAKRMTVDRDKWKNCVLSGHRKV